MSICIYVHICDISGSSPSSYRFRITYLYITHFSIDRSVAGQVPHPDRARAAGLQDERVLWRRQAAHRVQVGHRLTPSLTETQGFHSSGRIYRFKWPYNSYLFTVFRVWQGRTEKSTFYRSFETKNRVEILTKKSRNPERKWFFLKFSFLHK